MKKKSNYLFFILEEKNGEYEYQHKIVEELSDGRKTTAERTVNNYAKNFYGGIPEKEDDGYLFNYGETFVRVNSWQFINERQYDVLKQFL